MKTNEKDFFDVLKKDHERVNDLFDQIAREDEDRQRTLFFRLRNELEVHSQLEEEILYPRLEAEDETREMAENAEKEHSEVREYLTQLESLDVTDTEWHSKLRELKKVFKNHVKEEEGPIFRKMRKIFDENMLDEMRDQFIEAKVEIEHQAA